MKAGFIFFIFTCTVMACNQSNLEIRNQIANSDSVAINYFRGDGTMDTVEAIRIIRDKQKIDQLISFIAERSIKENHTCGYDGSIHFFKMNKVIQDIGFRMNTGECTHFSFQLNGKFQATSLSPAAHELINSFR